MLGLKYIGNKSGVNLVLYKSYSTVSLTPVTTYQFTLRDDTSTEAEAYYRSLQDRLEIRVVYDEEDLYIPSNHQLRTREAIKKHSEQVVLQAKEDNKIVPPQVESVTPVNDLPLSQYEEVDSDPLAVAINEDPNSIMANDLDFGTLTEAELAEYLELTFETKEELKNLINNSEIPIEVAKGNKSVGKIVETLVTDYKDQVIVLLNSK